MKISYGRKTVTSEIAYLAGFFDGEGCVRIKYASQRGSSYYVWVAVTNSNYAVLQCYKNMFGGQIRQAEKSVNKIIYHYLITSAEAVDMLKVLGVFLKEKKPQAELAITYHETKDTLTLGQKETMAKQISEMKREVIGNIYENPELLK